MAAGFSPTAAGTPLVQLTDADIEETRANAELTLLFHLSAERKMGCFQLGRELHRSLHIRRFVEVKELGFNWYSAKFTTQSDYQIAFETSSAWLFNCYQIKFYQWVLNFQPYLFDGDIIEGRLQQIPSVYCTDRLVTKFADTACASLVCRVLMVDSKSSRFWFQSIGTNSCSHLPLQIQIANGGPLVGLTYSLSQQCHSCGGFGHHSRNCWGNRATSSRSIPTHAQVRRRPLHPEPVPMADPREQQTHPENTLPPVTHEETTPIAPIHSSSGITTPPRSIAEKEMPAKGAIIVETGRESMPILYTLREEVSEIDVTMNVTPLNDQRGNQRRVTIDPLNDIAPNCIKRVIYTSIDGADDQDAIRMLIDKCSEGNISVAIVLDKSSVLFINNRIVRYLGFSASHRAEMTFPSFGSDGSAMEVNGNCLIMWKREEVRVNVSANTERHLKFNALWLVGESDEEDSDGLSNGFTTTCGEEGSTSDSNESSSNGDADSDGLSNGFTTTCGEEDSTSDSNESSSSGDTDSGVFSVYSTAGEELPNESDDGSPILSSDAEESSFFSTSGEERSPETSTSSDFSIFPANSDANSSPYASDSEVSSVSLISGENSSESSTVSSNRYTDAEEISYGSSAPSTSSEEGHESFILFPNGD